jgi:VIT1/CCC1 family predicted Fe2+/Mn2+ transporter
MRARTSSGIELSRSRRDHSGDPVHLRLGTAAIVAAAILSLVAHFVVGAAKSLVTLRSWWSARFEMTFAGVIVGGATYLVGLAFPT